LEYDVRDVMGMLGFLQRRDRRGGASRTNVCENNVQKTALPTAYNLGTFHISEMIGSWIRDRKRPLDNVSSFIMKFFLQQ
jgi:hypothetical protein